MSLAKRSGDLLLRPDRVPGHLVDIEQPRPLVDVGGTRSPEGGPDVCHGWGCGAAVVDRHGDCGRTAVDRLFGPGSTLGHVGDIDRDAKRPGAAFAAEHGNSGAGRSQRHKSAAGQTASTGTEHEYDLRTWR